MHFEEKIVFLSGLVDNSLSLTNYTEWELSSYCSGSLFALDGPFGHIRAKNLVECIDKAMRIVKREVANG